MCVCDTVVNYVIAYLSVCMILASFNMEDRWRLGIHYGSVVKETVVCRITNAFPADVETNEAGGYRKREDDLMSKPVNQLSDDLQNWNSASRMLDK